MPNYNAKENSNNFGGLGPKEAGKLGGRKKGENRKKRMEDSRREDDVELNENRKNSKDKSSK